MGASLYDAIDVSSTINEVQEEEEAKETIEGLYDY